MCNSCWVRVGDGSCGGVLHPRGLFCAVRAWRWLLIVSCLVFHRREPEPEGVGNLNAGCQCVQLMARAVASVRAATGSAPTGGSGSLRCGVAAVSCASTPTLSLAPGLSAPRAVFLAKRA